MIDGLSSKPFPVFLPFAALAAIAALIVTTPTLADDPLTLESPRLMVTIDAETGSWSLLDKQAKVRWPSDGDASLGIGEKANGELEATDVSSTSIRLAAGNDTAVTFELTDRGRCVMIRYTLDADAEIRVLGDALAVTDVEGGRVLVPCREGLLVRADSGVAFKRAFGTSDYEGCHMNMIGLLKSDAALVVSWEDAYVRPELESVLLHRGPADQRVTTSFALKRSARSLRLTPLGKGDCNTIAAGYRRIARQKGLAVTLREKIRRNPHAELLVGAANVKLWTCLARRMNEESTKEESVNVRWTFDEAAAIAEHLKEDLGIARCLFIMGGWTEGGYDCRHPDNLPANPECGGNEGLADAVRRIQGLGYVASLHDNYQDMYRDAKSWNPADIEKRPDGSLIQGGRWLGGRAYMVCARRQFDLAMRPQNLPAIAKLFGPWSYFIDTTYAVGPRECADPNHPVGRNEDIAWKIRLSDKARELFGLFGSECGREWALPHSDFFEGLVGVSGRYYHNLKPDELGARVIPFWEMVYHDCQICYGKYGYAAQRAGQYVAHHVLCARPLHYHSIPDHRYWTGKSSGNKTPGKPTAESCFTRTDGGWAEGLHPVDAFLKTTHEVLGPLHAVTAHQRLTRFEWITDDGSVRRATYGQGADATVVTVNFAAGEATVPSNSGGEVLLPPWGFVVESPRFVAFYAKRFAGRSYPDGALFTLRAVEEEDLGGGLDRGDKVRIFHGFGDPKITFKDVTYEVAREQVVAVGR